MITGGSADPAARCSTAARCTATCRCIPAGCPVLSTLQASSAAGVLFAFLLLKASLPSCAARQALQCITSPACTQASPDPAMRTPTAHRPSQLCSYKGSIQPSLDNVCGLQLLGAAANQQGWGATQLLATASMRNMGRQIIVAKQQCMGSVEGVKSCAVRRHQSNCLRSVSEAWSG